jgi:hypothetical protein
MPLPHRRAIRRHLAIGWCLLGGSVRLAAQAPTAPRDTVSLDRPTLLAFFIVNPAVIDSDPSGDLAVTADDFAYHLGSAIPTLDSMGVAVKETLDSVVILRDSAAIMRRFPVRGSDSLVVGYWLLGTGRTPKYLEGGVKTDLDLVQAAAEFFQLALPAGR